MSAIHRLHQLPEDTIKSLDDYKAELETLTGELTWLTDELRKSMESSTQATDDCIATHAEPLMKALNHIARSTDQVYDVLDRTGSSQPVVMSLEGESSDPATETDLPSRLLKALEKPFLSEVAKSADEKVGWTVNVAKKLLDDERKVLRALSGEIATRQATYMDDLYESAMATLRGLRRG